MTSMYYSRLTDFSQPFLEIRCGPILSQFLYLSDNDFTTHQSRLKTWSEKTLMAPAIDAFTSLFPIALDITFQRLLLCRVRFGAKGDLCMPCVLSHMEFLSCQRADVNLDECCHGNHFQKDQQGSKKFKSVWVDHPTVVWETEDQYFQEPIFEKSFFRRDIIGKYSIGNSKNFKSVWVDHPIVVWETQD